ncbi:WD40-repeat-containing domain protein [Absidia repens]|uniref:WD40-repeat-containing domain protein n=1 Tax=Absidia repens TaxID=90262 RepID=A0A1X2IDQ3_9FUNG|nr:WD40-repeat-containing domain protein [Absidia repens]
MTISTTMLGTGHDDLVHDIEYDYYGKRLVSCSSDQRLKVWDLVETGDAAGWETNDTWKGHDASIIKASWAPPEYGQIIASCSLDRTVKIWEEQPVESRNSQRRWSERFRFLESRGTVMDIAFSPRPGALRLASCSSDGIVRIYECLEPTNLTQWSQMEEFAIDMGQDSTSPTLDTPPLKSITLTSSLLSQQQLLQQHQLQEQQQIRQLQLQNEATTTSTAAKPSSSKHQQSDTHAHQMTVHDFPQQDQKQPSASGARSQPPHLGTLVSPPDIATMFQQQQQQQQQHLPLRTPSSNSSGTSSITEYPQLPFGFHIPSTPGPPPAPPPPSMPLPGVTSSLAMSSLDQQQQQRQQVDSHQQYDRHHPTDTMNGFCIHWCPNRTTTAMMVVGLGKEYDAKIFKHDGQDRWQPGEVLSGHTNQVNDVSWAPSMGRTYQLIATACKDYFVRIFKLTHTIKMNGSRVNMLNKQPSSKPSGPYHVEMVAEFGQHQVEVCRVEWNIMGTILSSSGSDGSVRLWKAGNDGAWREMKGISTCSQPE